MMYIICGIFIWTICSILWFFHNLGKKHGYEDCWYDYVLSVPALCICWIIGLLVRIFK